MRKCKHCGKSFEPRIGTQEYCSKSCNNRAYKDSHPYQRKVFPHRHCEQCGCEYIPTRNDAKYCSVACKRRANYIAERDGLRNQNLPIDPNQWSVTTPYGSHSFDWWVKSRLEGGGAVSHV